MTQPFILNSDIVLSLSFMCVCVYVFRGYHFFIGLILLANNATIQSRLHRIYFLRI
jgi:hypothetical protein